MSIMKTPILEKLRAGVEKDHEAEVFKMEEEGRSTRFYTKHGLIYTEGGRVYVPRSSEIKRLLMRECHDTQSARHPGTHHMYALLIRAFYWLKMREQVCDYVKTCLYANNIKR